MIRSERRIKKGDPPPQRCGISFFQAKSGLFLGQLLQKLGLTGDVGVECLQLGLLFGGSGGSGIGLGLFLGLLLLLGGPGGFQLLALGSVEQHGHGRTA